MKTEKKKNQFMSQSREKKTTLACFILTETDITQQQQQLYNNTEQCVCDTDVLTVGAFSLITTYLGSFTM